MAIACAFAVFSSCEMDDPIIDGEQTEVTPPEQEPEEEEPVYETKVVLNELCGNKPEFIELYNVGEGAADISSWTLYKNNEEKIWTAPEGTVIPVGGYLVLLADQADPAKGFVSGFSAKKEVKIELKDAEGVLKDTFLRGVDKTPMDEMELPENGSASFSRVPDGTGDFVYAVPTQGKANGEKTGDIEHEAPKEIVIEGLEVPAYVAVGDNLVVKGSGFAADAVFTFEKDGAKVEVSASEVDGGISLAVPADMARDHYALVLSQEGVSKTLSEDVWVTIRKAFKSATLNMSGTYGLFSYGWTVTRTDGQITEIRYKNSNADDIDSPSNDFIDIYVADGLTFTNTQNKTEYAYNKTVTFVEEGGLIKSAEAVNEYDDPMSYVWNYDDNGYIMNITHNEDVKYEVVYDADMNATEFVVEGWTAAGAKYDGAQQHNNPYAPSVAFAVASVYQYTFMHHHFAYFNGMIKAGTLLPTSIDWQGYGNYFGVTYTFDDDGYVTRISWSDPSYSDYSRIAIKYE